MRITWTPPEQRPRPPVRLGCLGCTGFLAGVAVGGIAGVVANVGWISATGDWQQLGLVAGAVGCFLLILGTVTVARRLKEAE